MNGGEVYVESALEIPVGHVLPNAFLQDQFEDRAKQHIFRNIVSWRVGTGLEATLSLFSTPIYPLFGEPDLSPFILNPLESFYFSYCS